MRIVWASSIAIVASFTQITGESRITFDEMGERRKS